MSHTVALGDMLLAIIMLNIHIVVYFDQIWINPVIKKVCP